MKKVSKISALIAVVLLLVGLTGCGEKPAQTQTQSPTPTPTPTQDPATTISTSSELKSFLNGTTGDQLGRLSNDITATTSNITIPAGKTKVLDLNGYTITKTTTGTTGFNVEGNLTIKDSSSGKTGKIKYTKAWSVFDVPAGGSFTLESGTLEATDDVGDTVCSKGGVVTIKGGVVKSSQSDCLTVQNGGRLVVQDGEIRSLASNAVEALYYGGDANSTATTVKITGGKFYSARGSTVDDLVYKDSAVVLTCHGTTEITGGEFYGKKGIYVGENDTVTTLNNATIYASLYCLDNHGTINEIDNGTFKSLSDGTTVETIINWNSGTIENIKGGSFIAESSRSAYGLHNSGTATVSGGNFSGTYNGSSRSYIGYGLYNSGTLTVTGGSFNGGSEGHGKNYNDGDGTINLSSSLSANSVFTPALTNYGTINQ